MVRSNRTEQTYYYERWRAITAGIIETAGTTFLLLIAVRWFQAGAIAKAVVAGSSSFGLLLSPLVVARVAKLQWPVAKAASTLAAAGSASFLVMALAPALPVFAIGSVLAMASVASAVPLMTQIYQDNYPERVRGRLFSRTIMIRIATAALFSDLAGRAFSGRLDKFQWLLLVFSGAFMFASFCLSRCPSRPLAISEGTRPFKNWRCLREDRLFRNTLICWMLMGFANLMMLPLRVEYLANPKYGLALTVGMIALFTGVIPNLARLALSPVWGWLFDHVNFFILRVTLNIGFALGILTFFISGDFSGLVIGAIVFGMSMAGGDVAWGLWVTKFAPPDRVVDYMSVHTFFTGVRGVIAPLVSFHLLAYLTNHGLPGLTILGWASAGLIFIASLLLLPEIRFDKAVRPATALVEEVSE